MIATLILALALTSVLAVVAQSGRFVNDIRQRAKASEILQSKLEQIRVETWTGISSLPATFTDPSDTIGRYRGTITTSSYDTYSSTTTVRRVTLTVTWTNQVGRVQTNALCTLFTNGGLNDYVR